MKKLIGFLVLVAGFITIGIQTGYAYGCPGMYSEYSYDEEVYSPSYRTWRAPWRRGWYYEELTSEQREKLRALEQMFEKEFLRLRKDIRTKHLELLVLRLKDESALEKIEKKLDEISEAEEKLERMFDEYRNAMKKILPEEKVAGYLNNRYLTDWSDYWYLPGRFCWWMMR